jgi:hypothetical protein
MFLGNSLIVEKVSTIERVACVAGWLLTIAANIHKPFSANPMINSSKFSISTIASY